MELGSVSVDFHARLLSAWFHPKSEHEIRALIFPVTGEARTFFVGYALSVALVLQGERFVFQLHPHLAFQPVVFAAISDVVLMRQVSHKQKYRTHCSKFYGKRRRNQPGQLHFDVTVRRIEQIYTDRVAMF